ncbi:MAG: NUDIX domain-containing protein [Candidatus Coprovivens sp.]
MKRSSGILPYKVEDGKLLVYLERPGGPFWEGKNKWSICKGEHKIGESCIDAAVREFSEESGFLLDKEKMFYIGSSKQASRKLITVFGIETDLDVTKMTSNTFKREFPKGSGIINEYPEMAEAKWFTIDEALEVIFDGQIYILNKLANMIDNLL